MLSGATAARKSTPDGTVPPKGRYTEQEVWCMLDRMMSRHFRVYDRLAEI